VSQRIEAFWLPSPASQTGHAIEELARTDEDCQSLCAGLAEVEAALLRWEPLSLPVKEARCAGYWDLVRDLAAELGATLDRSA
jgi:hypothetical protein